MSPIRPLAPIHRGQNRVDLVRWGRRLAVSKSRRPTHRHRHAKEAAWVARARALGIPTPPLLAAISDQRGHHLLTPVAPPRRAAWRPVDWLARLAPLHRLDPPPGWGPLRADGRPRWRDRAAAADWYAERARGLFARPGPMLALLEGYWATAVPGLIHGDVHRGNRAGPWIIDWEQVAVADLLEEAARAALTGGWGTTAWAAAAGVPEEHPRWRGALAAAAVEAVATGGPRQVAAWRWLAGAGATDAGIHPPA